MRSKTERAQSRLPPELVDRIIDFLHNEPKALAACSLVARSWTPTSRYHRFSAIRLISTEDWAKFDRLTEISPTMVHYIRGVTVDIDGTGAYSTRWISSCPSLTSLEHITVIGGTLPEPWRPRVAAIPSVAHKITSLTLNVTFISRHNFWSSIRVFPNLVSLRSAGRGRVPEFQSPQPPFPCYSPPISSISIGSAGQGRVLGHVCNPPYPLTSLSTLDIRVVHPGRGHAGLQTLAETYAGQISRLRLHVRTHSHQCTSLRRFRSLPSF
jgi:hypothetical protein